MDLHLHPGRCTCQLSDTGVVAVTPAREAFDWDLQLPRNRSWFSPGPVTQQRWLWAMWSLQPSLLPNRFQVHVTLCQLHTIFSDFFSFLAAEHRQTMTNRISGNLLFADVCLDYHSPNRGGRGGSVPHSTATWGKSSYLVLNCRWRWVHAGRCMEATEVQAYVPFCWLGCGIGNHSQQRGASNWEQ